MKNSAIRIEPRKCHECAIWRPERCDPFSLFGICPRKEHPNSITREDYGCNIGVVPNEYGSPQQALGHQN